MADKLDSTKVLFSIARFPLKLDLHTFNDVGDRSFALGLLYDEQKLDACQVD